MRFPFRFAGAFLVSATMICANHAVSQTPQSDAPPPPAYNGPPRGGPEHRVEMLQRALNLTPDQTTQVKALLETEHSKMEAVHSNTALSQDDRRSQMMAIHQDTTTKMHALLSTEQATKYDSLEVRMREHRQEGGNPPPQPPSGGPGER